MNQPVKAVVAGIGFIGPVHIESLRRLPGIEVTAISHSTITSAAKKASELGIANYYANYQEMLEKERPDVVHICTPNHLHYDMAKLALENDIHVVCEKPLATSVRQAEELIAIAEKKQLVHAVNFNIRYYPLVRQMKAIREKGELGTIYSVIGSYLQDWLFFDTDYNWRLEPEQSGESKAIADIGSHLLDAIEYITGLEITEVFADFSTIHPVRKKSIKPIETYSHKMEQANETVDVPVVTEDYATVLLRFNNNTKGVATVSQVAAGRKNRLSLEISGANKTVHWESEKPGELWIGYRDAPNTLLLRDPSLVDADTASIISYPGGHNEGFPDTSKQLFKEIYAAVRVGIQPTNPSYPTFKSGLRELKLCEKIIESNKVQQWVKV